MVNALRLPTRSSVRKFQFTVGLAARIENSSSMSLSSIATATANPWLRILGALEKKISRHSFDTWLKPTRFSHASANVICVRVPTPEFRHIAEKFGDLIQE